MIFWDVMSGNLIIVTKMSKMETSYCQTLVSVYQYVVLYLRMFPTVTSSPLIRHESVYLCHLLPSVCPTIYGKNDQGGYKFAPLYFMTHLFCFVEKGLKARVE